MQHLIILREDASKNYQGLRKIGSSWEKGNTVIHNWKVKGLSEKETIDNCWSMWEEERERKKNHDVLCSPIMIIVNINTIVLWWYNLQSLLNYRTFYQLKVMRKRLWLVE